MSVIAWLRGRPVLRGVAILGPAVAIALTAGRLLTPAGQDAHDLSPATAAPAPVIAGPPAPEAASPGQPTARPPVPDAAALAAAAAVAKAFLVGYASYRYDDGPGVLRSKLRPYDTDTLDGSLAQGGGAGVGLQQRVQQHEVASATVENVNSEGLAPDGRLVMVALVSQAITSDQGPVMRPR
jgi:hypothetical protein